VNGDTLTVAIRGSDTSDDLKAALHTQDDYFQQRPAGSVDKPSY